MPVRDWRKHLTAAEKKAVKKLDKEIAALDERVAILRMKRGRIQNRASVRAGR